MKGDKNVIKHLNIGLKKELTAVNQYFLHARMLENWGVSKLAKHEYAESIEEMGHADRFIKRILLLGGMPSMQGEDKLSIGKSVKEVLESDLALEYDGHKAYKEAIAACESAADYVSADLFMSILAEEEGHISHLESQLSLIKQIGVERYIELNSGAIGEGEGES